MAEANVKSEAGETVQPNSLAPSQPANAQPPVTIEDAAAITGYANFCRVNGTPEELIIDFGLNAQAIGAAAAPLKVTQRVVVNYFTAKRLLSALHVAVQRHEAAFGVLETDVQKRVASAARRN